MAAASAVSAAPAAARPAASAAARRPGASTKGVKQPLWTRSFIAGTLLNFFIAANYFMLMVVMTAYALNVYGAPPAAAAFCASAFIVGTLFSRFASAPIMERFGRMPTLIVGAVLEVGLTALYLLDEPLVALMAVRLAHGFAYGLCSTTIATVVTGLIPAERKGEGIGYFMLSVTLGSAIGPFVGIYIANNFGYDVLFAMASVLVALAVPCAALLRPAKATGVRGSAERARDEQAAASDVVAEALVEGSTEGRREQAASDALETRARLEEAVAKGGERVVRCEEDAATAAGAAGASDGGGEEPRRDDPASRGGRSAEGDGCSVGRRVPSTHLEERIAAKVARSPLARFVEAGVLPISIVCGLLFFGYSSLLTFLTPYANDLGLGRAASVFFVVYALAMFATRPFTGRAFDRRGPHPVMVPAFVSFACGMVVLAFAFNDWMILGAAALLGFGVGTVQSCGLAMAVRVTSDARLSVANATFYMLLDVGVGIGPILLGLASPLIGYANLYLCMAGVGVAALLLFLIVARTEKGVR